ncbi:hypothetical protein KC950_03885, partial [Candidatus Saccharibacteria bacterium]|nr:hypothetical protein [Candidatus Saccharibacteria bacterium]
MSSESHTSTHDSEAANMLAHVEANGDMVASVFNELRTDLASPYSESQVAIDSLRFASQEAIRNARLLQDIAGTLPLRFDASPSNQAISELRRKVSLSSRSEASADILVDDAATL